VNIREREATGVLLELDGGMTFGYSNRFSCTVIDSNKLVELVKLHITAIV
jgi:hypothetical protein